MVKTIVQIQRGQPHHARIHIPREICEALKLKQGDFVEIDVRKFTPPKSVETNTSPA